MRWAGARSAAWPTCWARTATWAMPQHRAEAGRAVGRATTCPPSPARARWRCSRPRPTGRSRRCGSSAPTRRSRCPTRPRVRRALQRAEFVVLQEAYRHTATADFADLLLPATSWGEKDGTVTNSERRISRVRAALPAPGEARDDWRIGVDVARRLEATLPARRRDGADAVPLRHGRKHLERTPRQHPRPRPGHHRPELGRAGAAAAVALPRRRDAQGRRGCTTTAASPRPTAARASSRRPGEPRPRCATRASRCR